MTTTPIPNQRVVGRPKVSVRRFAMPCDVGTSRCSAETPAHRTLRPPSAAGGLTVVPCSSGVPQQQGTHPQGAQELCGTGVQTAAACQVAPQHKARWVWLLDQRDGAPERLTIYNRPLLPFGCGMSLWHNSQATNCRVFFMGRSWDVTKLCILKLLFGMECNASDPQLADMRVSVSKIPVGAKWIVVLEDLIASEDSPHNQHAAFRGMSIAVKSSPSLDNFCASDQLQDAARICACCGSNSGTRNFLSEIVCFSRALCGGETLAQGPTSRRVEQTLWSGVQGPHVAPQARARQVPCARRQHTHMGHLDVSTGFFAFMVHPAALLLYPAVRSTTLSTTKPCVLSVGANALSKLVWQATEWFGNAAATVQKGEVATTAPVPAGLGRAHTPAEALERLRKDYEKAYFISGLGLWVW